MKKIAAIRSPALRRAITLAALVLLASGVLFAAAGCVMYFSGAACGFPYHQQRTIELTASLEEEGAIVASTKNGSIQVIGVDGDECRLRAQVHVDAASDEVAQRLAEDVSVRLEPCERRLHVKIDRPKLWGQGSIRVDLEIEAPRRAHLELTTHNGNVSITDVTADLRVRTHNGSVQVDDITGSPNVLTHNGSIRLAFAEGAPAGRCELASHNGPVTCRGAPGDVRLRSHNGSVTLSHAQTSGGARQISVVTHNGAIDYTPPEGLSASVDITTHKGPILLKRPLRLTLQGRIHRALRGTIGSGGGRLHMRTHNGSITIH